MAISEKTGYDYFRQVCRLISAALRFAQTALLVVPICANAQVVATYGQAKLPVTFNDIQNAIAQLKPELKTEYLGSEENIKQLASRIALARERQTVEAGLSEQQIAQIAIEGELARYSFAQRLQDDIAVEAAKGALQSRQKRVAELYALKNEACVAPPTYRASHILVRTDNKTLMDAIRLIGEVQTSLASGTSFEEVAKKYSEDDSSAKDGGKLPAFPRTEIDRLFAKEYFRDQKIGRISAPFQTRYGFHVLRVDGDGTPEKLVPLAQCAAALERLIDKELAEKAVAKLQEAFAAKAKVQFNDEAIRLQVKVAQEAAKEKSQLIEKALRAHDAQSQNTGTSPAPMK